MYEYSIKEVLNVCGGRGSQEMKNLFGRISEKLKKSEDEEWFGQVRQLKQEFDAIDIEVQIALTNKPSEDLLPAFNKACSNIPIILARLKGLLPKDGHTKSSWQVFQEALNTYLLACEHFRGSVHENDEREYVRGIKEMKDAKMLLKQAKNLFK